MHGDGQPERALRGLNPVPVLPFVLFILNRVQYDEAVSAVNLVKEP